MPECRVNRARRRKRAAKHVNQLDAQCHRLRTRLAQSNLEAGCLRSYAHRLEQRYEEAVAAERKKVTDFLWPLVSLHCGPQHDQKIGVYLTVEANPARLEFAARDFRDRLEMARWLAGMLTDKLAEVLVGLPPACAREKMTLKGRAVDEVYTGGRP